MTRTTARRALGLTATGACLAALGVPASAQQLDDPNQDTVVVQAEAPEGARTFFVAKKGEGDGVDLLDRLVFDQSGEQEFRVVVKDVNRTLDTGFQVTASMTDLYYLDGTSHDPEWIIPSRNIGLKFRSSNPLEALGVSTPVRPVLSVGGTLGSCLDQGVQDTLGIEGFSLLGGVLGTLEELIDSLTESLALVCEGLGETGAVAGTITDDTVTPLGLSPTVDSLLALPVGLLGAQDSGTFDSPSYEGAIAGPHAPDVQPPAATTKRVLAGTPLMTQSLLTTLTQTLDAAVTAPGSLLTLDEMISAIASVNPTLAQGLRALVAEGEGDRVVALLSPLVVDLVPLTRDALDTVSGSYVAHPVLTANTTASRPGTYEGTLIVDFIDGIQPG